MTRVLVTGGSGFVGRHLVAQLAANGCHVTVPTRYPPRARPLIVLPHVRVVEASLHDDAAVASLLEGQDAVVNLVGILHGRPGAYPPPDQEAASQRWPLDVAALQVGPDFGRAHIGLTDRLVRLSPPGLRFVQMSGLGTQAAEPARLPSRYLRSRAAAEAVVRASSLDWTIVRPSVLFGDGDSSTTLFAALLAWLPFMILPRADAKLQPLWVSDLAKALAGCLVDPRRGQTSRQAFEVGGAEVMTLAELVRRSALAAGHRRPVIGVSDGLGYRMAGLMEKLPGPTLMSTDNLDSMALANVLGADARSLLSVFGIVPRPLDEVLPTYLGRPKTRYDLARTRAR